MHTLLAVKVVILLGAIGFACAQTKRVELSLQVEPQRQDCFYEDAKAGDMIEAGVMVFRGGKLDIKLRVEAPDQRVLHDQLILSNIDEATGRMLPTIVEKSFKWGAPVDGTYVICLDNRMAKWTAKVATLRVTHKDPKDGRGDYGLDPAQPPSEGMRLVAQRLHAKLEQVRNLQSYHFHRERRHRDTVESTNWRVQWWGICENVVIAITTLFMILLIKQWFKRAGGLLPGKV